MCHNVLASSSESTSAKLTPIRVTLLDLREFCKMDMRKWRPIIS